MMDCVVGGASPSHDGMLEAIFWLQGEEESGEEIGIGWKWMAC